MPWKERYTLSDETSLGDDDVRWPEGQRLCVNIVVDLSLATDATGIRPDDLRRDRAMFGLREGLDQIASVLERFERKATFAVPAVMAEILREPLRDLHAGGHEIAAHGFKHEDVSQLEPAEERERLALATEILGNLVGEPPRGWYSLPRASDPFAVGTVSAHTMDLVIDAATSTSATGSPTTSRITA